MIKLFTHTDLDGVSCRILAELCFGKYEVDATHCNYNDINVKVVDFFTKKEHLKYDKIFITDISIKEDVAKELEELGFTDNLVLIDHHKTALDLNQYDWAEVTEGFCATVLFYNHLVNTYGLSESQAVRRYAHTVNSYDMWLWKEAVDADAGNLNGLLYIYGIEMFAHEMLCRLSDESFRFTPKDEVVLKIREREIKEYVEKKDSELATVKHKEYKMGYVFAERFQSELGDQLCEMHPEIDFIAMIDMSRAISLRSRKPEIDLTEIAKNLGGGGHPQSAGCPVKGVKGYVEMLFGGVFDEV